MRAKNKKDFIDTWNSHIDSLGILAFCDNMEDGNRILAIRKELKDLVIRIAKTKKW